MTSPQTPPDISTFIREEIQATTDAHPARPWTVARKPPNVPQQELTIHEHFTQLENEDRGIELPLIREDFQNRYDRKRSDLAGPVKIRIYLSGVHGALPTETARKYFSGLRDHLEASNDIMDSASLLNGACEFMVIECFGTTGLEGDERQHFRGATDPENHFQSLLRSFGISGNRSGSAKGGSWGVGRSVYFYTSQIHAMLVLSVRNHEDPARRRVMMGENIMRYHNLNGITYMNIGYFGMVENPDTDLVLPYYDTDILDRFSRDWRLKRTSETGLSTVIPYVKEIDVEKLLYTILSEYGSLILNGALEVTLETSDGAPIHLTTESAQRILGERANSPEWKETQALLNLLSIGQSLPLANVIQLPMVKGGTALSDVHLEEAERARVLEILESGQTAKVVVPVEVTRTNGETQQSKFEILLQDTGENVGIRPVFYRDHLRISGKEMSQAINGIRTVFLAGGAEGERLLTDLLTMAEGPSHTEWVASREKLKGRFKHGPTWVRLCMGMPRRLVALIRGNQDEPDTRSLADLFPDPDNQPASSGNGGAGRESGTVRRARRRRGRGGGGGKSRRPFVVTPLPNRQGFLIQLDPESKVASRFTVDLAYAVNSGSSFGKWEELDFSLSDLTLDCPHGVIESPTKNQFTVLIRNKKKFRLTISGFDGVRVPALKIVEKGGRS